MTDPTSEQRLFAAAAAGDEALVAALIEQGADAAYQDEEGTSVLMTAAENGHATIVARLLEAGAPWNAQDAQGYCAGEYASRNQAIVQMLMEWGVQAELLLAAAERRERSAGASPANATYLQQRLVYDGDRLLDADGEAVMMGWEGPLMERHAEAICGAVAGDVINIGFGLGLIDEEIQKRHPRSHTIVEAHPDVHAHMLQLGWDKRPGVRILFGRWQDVLHQMGTYDGVFFDTYGEYYEELRDFHLQLPSLLKPGGTYSFFNGLAPDNLFFHLVYGRLVQVELQDLGFTTRYVEARVDELGDEVWRGVKSRYWHFKHYFLPLVTWAEVQAGEGGGGAEGAGDAGAGRGGSAQVSELEALGDGGAGATAPQPQPPSRVCTNL